MVSTEQNDLLPAVGVEEFTCLIEDIADDAIHQAIGQQSTCSVPITPHSLSDLRTCQGCGITFALFCTFIAHYTSLFPTALPPDFYTKTMGTYCYDCQIEFFAWFLYTLHNSAFLRTRLDVVWSSFDHYQNNNRDNSNDTDFDSANNDADN